MKRCTKCQVEKPLEDFHKNKRRKDGHVGICKPCAIKATSDWQQRNLDKVASYQAKRPYTRHGISKEIFDALLENQAGLCAICSGEAIGNGTSHKRLNVDHDHKCCPGTHSCGKCIRGLLCNRCNTALGLMKDDRVAIQKMLDYLT